MSTQGAPAASQPGLKMGEALIRGRASAKSRAITTQNGRRYLTVVAMPAADEFSSPQVIEIRSEQPLADGNGDQVQVKVAIGGYRRSYEATDPHTGDKYKVQTAQVVLDAV